MTLLYRDTLPTAAARRFRFWCEFPTAARLFTHMVPCSMYSDTIAAIPDAVAAQAYYIVQQLGARNPADRAINFSGWLGLRELDALGDDVAADALTADDFTATRVALGDLLRILTTANAVPRFVYADPESNHSNAAKARMMNFALEGWSSCRAAWYLFAGPDQITDGHRVHQNAEFPSNLCASSNTAYFDTYARPQHPANRPAPWCWLIDTANNAAAIIRNVGWPNYCPVIATPHTHAEKFSTPGQSDGINQNLLHIPLPQIQATAYQWWRAATTILIELGTRNFVVFNHTGMNGQNYRGADAATQDENRRVHNLDDARAAEWLSTLAELSTTPATLPTTIPYTADEFTVGRWTFRLDGSNLEPIGLRQ